MNNGDVASVATKNLVRLEDYNCSGYNVKEKIDKWRNVEYINIRRASEKVSIALELFLKVKPALQTEVNRFEKSTSKRSERN